MEGTIGSVGELPSTRQDVIKATSSSPPEGIKTCAWQLLGTPVRALARPAETSLHSRNVLSPIHGSASKAFAIELLLRILKEFLG